ncbi:MAG: ISNCY family transposase [Bacteroidota bacterium]
MRKRFEQQMKIGVKPISGTLIPTKSRDAVPALLAAMKEIFIHPEHNEKVFSILEDKILKGKKQTGRPGMDLWQIFVLAQFRLGLDISYDRLHGYANYHSLLRQILGIETMSGFDQIEIGYQNIVDNVSLLNDSTLMELNQVIVDFGHGVFKKKNMEALRLKTDSFVVGSCVHFPTDYNILWDCARKCLDIVGKFLKKYPDTPSWRKLDDWYCATKGLMREVGRASSGGGKNKITRQKKTAKKYLNKATSLEAKLNSSKASFPCNDTIDLALLISLNHFMDLMNKHVGLVERRLIKGETIPHEEKMFSIFEDYTEWITKGKLRPNVELGKKLAITTDHFGLIVDYQIMDHVSDSEIVIPLADRLLNRYKVESWSFDKGFWHQDNKALLSLEVEKVIMPKKGKCNMSEKEAESSRSFKQLKNKHSAVESNINELEHSGLDRCPDRGYNNFKRYIGVGVIAYNLKRIGKQLLKYQREEEKEATIRLCA